MVFSEAGKHAPLTPGLQQRQMCCRQGMHADKGRCEFAERAADLALVAVQADGVGGEADVAAGLAHDRLVVHLGLGGDLAEDHHHVGLAGGLAGDLRGTGARERVQTRSAVRDMTCTSQRWQTKSSGASGREQIPSSIIRCHKPVEY